MSSLPNASTLSGQDIHERLHHAVEAARLRVVGHQDIYDLSQIRLMIALLEAYGQSAGGFMYAEPALLDSQIPPPDVVLALPEVGVIVFECKAYDLNYIDGIEAGNFKIRRYGRETLINPLRQGQRGMFAIKDVYESLAYDDIRPLFHTMIALPNIAEHDWTQQGYHHSLDSRIILFADHLEDAGRLRQHIGTLVQHVLERTGRTDPYPSGTEAILLRVFGDSAVINDARIAMRNMEPERLGAKIDALERTHKQLSAEQQYLSRFDTWGHPYLVRGVAGSGKSIVLANQVARTLYRHQKQHDQLTLFEEDRHRLPHIGVICFNRTLVPLLYERIRLAYEALTGSMLPVENITVTDLNRLLYGFNQRWGDKYFKYVRNTHIARAGERARQHRNQLEHLRQTHPDWFESVCFDAIFVDEGQDAHPEEYAILNTLIRPDVHTGERTLTIFYDDAQNLYGQPPPIWHNLSINMAGGRASLMQHCYRNTREILELGLNVLLGTQATQHMRVATRRFADIKSLEERGLVKETKAGWRVHFADTTETVPLVRSFLSRAEQLDWVAQAVVALIENEQVRPEHILIVAAKSTPFRHLSQRITQLSRQQIPLRMVGGLYKEYLDELLLKPDHLTLATIHAAKGYDAPVVFLVDADEIESTVLGRALFYVGVTRAKRYLIVSGVERTQTLLREALDVQAALYTGQP